MASQIFRSEIARMLRKTLDGVTMDSTDNLEGKASFTKWCDMGTMDHWNADFLETADSGLAAELDEGQTLHLGGMKEGVNYRFVAREFGRMVPITEIAMEDNKYPEAVDLAKRNKRSIWKTADVDAASLLNRAFSTSYPGPDGVPMFSASHPLPYGGVISNTMATPMSPSPAAYNLIASTVAKQKGHDGIEEGYKVECIICPTEQERVWWGIVNSPMTPVAGNFAEVNIINKVDKPDVYGNPFWNASSTNYCAKTDAGGGFTFLWRKRVASRTWVENSQRVMFHAITARWAIGWKDPRGNYGVNA